jgi:hypothetical protein
MSSKRDSKLEAENWGNLVRLSDVKALQNIETDYVSPDNLAMLFYFFFFS